MDQVKLRRTPGNAARARLPWCGPLPDRLVRHRDAAGGQHLLKSVINIFLRPCDSNHSADRGPMPTLGFGRFRSERRVPWRNESRPCCAGLRKPSGDRSWNSRRSTRASASGQRRQRSQASSRLFLSACPASCVQRSGAAPQSLPEQTDARHQRMGQAPWVGPLESAAMLRDGVLRNLVSRGDLPRSAASDS